MSNESIENLGFKEHEKIYTLTEKQLQDLVKKEAQALRAEERKMKAQEELNRMIAKNTIVFVEIPDKDKNILQRIAKGICSMFEWKWSLEREENIRKRNLELLRAKTKVEIAKKRGLMD